ncbi:MAG: class I adenylate-forming enzyme family protein [Acidimicrobiales bacterium]
MAQPEKGSLTAVPLTGPDAAAAIVGEWEEGRAVLPLDPKAPAAERRRILDALRPTHQVGEFGTRALPGGTPVAPEVAAVVATTGTTGEPKGVELTWAGLAASARSNRQALAAVAVAVAVAEERSGHVSAGQDQSKRDQNSGGWLCCLPLYGIGGLGVVARTWSTGVPVEVTKRFDPADVAASQASFVSLVPTTLSRCLDAGVDLSGFRAILVGGARLDPRLRSRATEAGASVVATYGLTETWGGVVYDGRPVEGVEVHIADDDEIVVRGPMVMRGYRLRPDDTAAALSPDGWLRTGDAGAWGPDGALQVVDRLRDLIVTGGVNVSPTEVESVLAAHPGVADVGVAGAPDTEWGERVVAHVVAADPADPPTLADLRDFAGERLSAAKLPRHLELVAEIPRTPGGKPLRRLLGGVENPGS